MNNRSPCLCGFLLREDLKKKSNLGLFRYKFRFLWGCLFRKPIKQCIKPTKILQYTQYNLLMNIYLKLNRSNEHQDVILCYQLFVKIWLISLIWLMPQFSN